MYIYIYIHTYIYYISIYLSLYIYICIYAYQYISNINVGAHNGCIFASRTLIRPASVWTPAPMWEVYIPLCDITHTHARTRTHLELDQRLLGCRHRFQSPYSRRSVLGPRHQLLQLLQHSYMSIYIYRYSWICLYIHMYTYLRIKRMFWYKCLCVHVFVHVCMHVCMYACMHICMHVCMYLINVCSVL